MCSAERVASAMIVNWGFTRRVEGKMEASQTKRFPTSWVSPKEFTTEFTGLLPIRQVPWGWNPIK